MWLNHDRGPQHEVGTCKQEKVSKRLLEGNFNAAVVETESLNNAILNAAGNGSVLAPTLLFKMRMECIGKQASFLHQFRINVGRIW